MNNDFFYSKDNHVSISPKTAILKERLNLVSSHMAKQLKEYNANRPTEDNTEADLVIDFYRRFIYRMEYMMKVGKEKGFDLMLVMGP